MSGERERERETETNRPTSREKEREREIGNRTGKTIFLTISHKSEREADLTFCKRGFEL